jgi:hypothetical protein
LLNFLKCIVIDVASGIYVFVFISLLSGQSFNLEYLAISIFFALAPDADFAPFILCNRYIFPRFRKNFRFASHHFIHFPLVFLPVSAVIGFGLADSYGVLLAFSSNLSHFIHDSWKPPEEMSGIQWKRFLIWGPRDLYFFWKCKICKLPYEEWKKHLDEKRKTAKARTMAKEISSRADRIGPIAREYIAFSFLLLFIFFVRN